MTIGVVATLTIREGKEPEFERVFSKLRDEVRSNEPGCLLYDLFRLKKTPGVYMVMEKYATQADLDAHGKTPHFTSAGPALMPLIKGPPQLQYLDLID